MAELTSRSTLKGWKSIADYFDRDMSTVMRWAAQRGLPVHRVPGEGRSSVYALSDELAAWLATAETPEREAARASGTTAVAAVQPLSAPEPKTEATAPPTARRSRHRLAVLSLAGVVSAAAAVAVVAVHNSARPVAHVTFRDAATERAYLSATYDLDLRTPASLERARNEFGSIIARDPGAAPAYAGLSETYLLLREYTAFPSGEAYRDAAAADRAAIALDPDLIAAHRSLAFVAFWGDHDIAAARTEFARARALDPNNAQTWHWYATALSANGEHDAALAAIGEARRLEPQSTPIAADYGLIAYLAGHPADGLAALRRVAASSPDHMSTHQYLADLALARGDGETYLAEAAIARRLRNDGAESAAMTAERAAFAHGGEALLLAAIAARRAAQVTATGGHFALAKILALQRHLPAADAQLRLAAKADEPDLAQVPGEIMLRGMAGEPAYERLRARRSLASDPERPATP